MKVAFQAAPGIAESERFRFEAFDVEMPMPPVEMSIVEVGSERYFTAKPTYVVNYHTHIEMGEPGAYMQAHVELFPVGI